MSKSTVNTSDPLTDEARLRRWRLVLSNEAESSCGKLSGVPAEMEQALAALIEADGKGGLKDRRGGRGGSAPSVARWLGDIRKYFPGTVVQGLAVRAGRRTLHSHPAAGAAHVFHSLLEQILKLAIVATRRPGCA